MNKSKHMPQVFDPQVDGSITNLRTLSTASIGFLIKGYFVPQVEALASALVKLSSVVILQLKGFDPSFPGSYAIQLA